MLRPVPNRAVSSRRIRLFLPYANWSRQRSQQTYGGKTESVDGEAMYFGATRSDDSIVLPCDDATEVAVVVSFDVGRCALWLFCNFNVVRDADSRRTCERSDRKTRHES